jgi:uncharacterized protein
MEEIMEKKDLQKLKKEELIELVYNQKHLAEAVEAKDREISKLKSDMKETIDKAIADGTAKAQSELGNLKNKTQSDFEAMKKSYEKEIEGLKLQMGNADETIRSLAESNNDALARYEGLLKIIQGGLDAHIELHDVSTKQFRSHFKNLKT